jgi:3-oxoacyl-[acyl-carrier-protein] synthase II
MSSTRVAITGFGAISPLGLTAADMWASLCAGRVVPKSYRKATKLMSRDIELAVIAANEAFAHAGLVTKGIDPENVNINPERTAIVLGAGLISCDLVELAPAVAASVTDGKFDIKKWGKEGIEQVTPLWLLKYLPNMLACHVGIIHDLQGLSNTITCAEAASHLAIAEAAQAIARGASDVALAGGAEAKVNPIVMIRQCLLKRTTIEHNDMPAAACRPFDADAKGSVFGEAGGVVVLEDPDYAAKRGATVYAEIIGLGESSSVNPVYEHIEPDGEGVRVAIEKAMADAQIRPEDLDLIIPHGTGIPADDLAEARAIRTALGEAAASIPVWPTKSMLSNTGTAGGALDVIAAVCAINEGRIPAAKNCDRKADGCDLNIVSQPIDKRIRHALCCSYTYGGQTAALILRRTD